MSRQMGVLVLTVVMWSLGAPARADVGARALEARLFAPCCWAGTLDGHQSDLARDLRHEIEARVAGGESTKDIQEDFVQRFGARVLASRDDRPVIVGSVLMGFLMIASAAGIALYVRRSLAAGRRERAMATDVPPGDDAEREAQLDRELAGFR